MRHRRLLDIAAVALAGMGVATPARAVEHVVTMPGEAFAPERLEVVAGDAVTWVNPGTGGHNARSFDSTFRSENLTHGATFTFTFTEPGTYDYRCTIHPSTMTGTIVVRADAALAPTASPAAPVAATPPLALPAPTVASQLPLPAASSRAAATPRPTPTPALAPSTASSTAPPEPPAPPRTPRPEPTNPGPGPQVTPAPEPAEVEAFVPTRPVAPNPGADGDAPGRPVRRWQPGWPVLAGVVAAAAACGAVFGILWRRRGA